MGRRPLNAQSSSGPRLVDVDVQQVITDIRDALDKAHDLLRVTMHAIEAAENGIASLTKFLRREVKPDPAPSNPAPSPRPTEPAASHEPLAVSVKQAQQILGISGATIYRRMQDGHIEAIRLGRRTLIPYAALKRLIQRPG